MSTETELLYEASRRARCIRSIAIAAELVVSGAGLADPKEIEEHVYNLLTAISLLAREQEDCAG